MIALPFGKQGISIENKSVTGIFMIEPDFEKGEGLVPVVVQEHQSGEVL